MVEARQLTKRFGPLTAIEQVSFSVNRGEILGFIGPNGAGKTTTMRILTGFLPATEGQAVVAGYDVFEDPMEVKRRVGYLPETPPLYRELTVGDYLGFVAELRGVPRAERLRRTGDVMERVGLRGWERRILGSLSKGYRQRVGLAQALIHNPPVLILDEPTSGLDPAQNVGVRELIASLAGDHTVILSTHILREVEALCSRVVLINRGRIAAAGPMDEVRASAAPPHYRVVVEHIPPQELAAALGALDVVDQVEPLEDAVIVRAQADPRPAIAGAIVARGWPLVTLERHVPTLEEAFIAIVGREDP
ncbi:MAG: ATP-binding cassette domain-containing protein [Alphaproteobacteria bacterium]|nr:ATP-binding cassette domain-containing protein [Alphaproteobacteria bacterium]